MAILNQAFNTIRSTIPKAMHWASRAQGVRIAGRLAYAPKLGAIGAGAGATVGLATSDRDHRARGMFAGAGLGMLAGTRIMPRLYGGGRILGAGRNIRGLLGR